jgi:spore coat protein U-like protein
MKEMKRVSFLLGIFLVASVASFASNTATSDMTVTASVTNNCTISANTLAFGAYDPVVTNQTSPLDQSTTVNVACTNGTSAKITFGQGANADIGGGSTDSAPLRRLSDGTNFLNYNLYKAADRLTVWGNDDATSVTYTGIGSGESVSVFGRIAGGQNKPAGSGYTDTVVATITF